MKYRQLEYSRTRNLGNFESERIGLTVDLDETEDLDEAFRTTKAKVFHLHEEGALLEESKTAVEADKQSEKTAPPETTYTEEDFNKLFWETKQGTKGEYQQTSKTTTANNPVFQALQALLKEKRGFCQLGAYKYWFHQNDADVIDRRKK